MLADRRMPDRRQAEKMMKSCTRNGVLRMQLDIGIDQPAHRLRPGRLAHGAGDGDDKPEQHRRGGEPDRQPRAFQQFAGCRNDVAELKSIIHVSPPSCGWPADGFRTASGSAGCRTLLATAARLCRPAPPRSRRLPRPPVSPASVAAGIALARARAALAALLAPFGLKANAGADYRQALGARDMDDVDAAWTILGKAARIRARRGAAPSGYVAARYVAVLIMCSLASRARSIVNSR